jgi:uncharacterized protein
LISLVAFSVTPRVGNKPWAASNFELPSRKDIDAPLILGAVMFGVGWGLAGYCPGPALASVLTGGLDAASFVAALILGMWATRTWQKRS